MRTEVLICVTLLVTVLIILYFNARSLCPKLDELIILTEDRNPDVICITETWLSQEISSKAISISGYLLYRRDRNCPGGGVLMYTRVTLQVKLLPQPPDLELLTLSLYSGNHRVCLALFYCPPSSSAEVFGQICTYLTLMLMYGIHPTLVIGICSTLCPFVP